MADRNVRPTSLLEDRGQCAATEEPAEERARRMGGRIKTGPPIFLG